MRKRPTGAVSVAAIFLSILMGAPVAVLTLPASPALADENKVLCSGCTLWPGQYLEPSPRYRLVMQTDGNLVIYAPGGAVWATATFTANSRLVMQSDGNLVIYRPNGSAAWASDTSSSQNAYSRMIMQVDGNFVMYRPNGQVVYSPTGKVPTNTAYGVKNLQNSSLKCSGHSYTCTRIQYDKFGPNGWAAVYNVFYSGRRGGSDTQQFPHYWWVSDIAIWEKFGTPSLLYHGYASGGYVSAQNLWLNPTNPRCWNGSSYQTNTCNNVTDPGLANIVSSTSSTYPPKFNQPQTFMNYYPPNTIEVYHKNGFYSCDPTCRKWGDGYYGNIFCKGLTGSESCP